MALGKPFLPFGSELAMALADYVFSPGICWSGLRVNRSGSEVQRLQMNS